MKEVVDRIVQYPNRYKLTDVSTGQDLGTYDFTEVPGTVQQEGTEINAELFESIEHDIENAGNFDPNGTYPNLTAGEATHAQSADSATNATNANYATSAGSANTATNATHATSATSATNATNDGLGRNIANTYALKSASTTKYKHTIIGRFVQGYGKESFFASFAFDVILTRSTAITKNDFSTLFNLLKGKAMPINSMYNSSGGADEVQSVIAISWGTDGTTATIYYGPMGYYEDFTLSELESGNEGSRFNDYVEEITD